MIFGATGIGIAAYEIFKSHDLVIFGFLDDRNEVQGKEIEEASVLGHPDDDGFLKFIGQKCEAFVATDDNEERRSIIKMLMERRKVMPVNAIHKNSSIAGSASISHGNFINDGVVMGANCTIGSHNIIHAGAVIEYDAVLGEYVQIGPGAVVGAGVKIQDEAFIGAGAVVVAGVSIGKHARIGAGSVVVDNVEDNKTVFGNPAKPVDI